jgi:hypothetical protein
MAHERTCEAGATMLCAAQVVRLARGDELPRSGEQLEQLASMYVLQALPYEGGGGGVAL